jgi:protein-L-isoaspartate(D-aspartate) O-methyltransferase
LTDFPVSYLKPRLIIIGLSLIALVIFKPQVFNPGTAVMPIADNTLTQGKEPLGEEDYRALRLAMVNQIRSQYGLDDEIILDAFNKVPRHLFIPEPDTALAYTNQIISARQGYFILAPYQTAWMIRLLEIESGDKVLAIGSCTAYITALITEMGFTEVYGIENDPQMAANGLSLLETLGYKNVSLKQGDLYAGWQENAPYDAILVSQTADQLPPSLSAHLDPGGRLVIPIGSPGEQQSIWQFIKQINGELSGIPQGNFLLPEVGVEGSGKIRGDGQTPTP